MASVHQINTSNGGVPKLPVQTAEITELGIVGDEQADKEHHGGIDMALCLFSLDVIERFQAEGHPIAPGSVGENLTISGIDWSEVSPGTRMAIGPEVEIEITQYTSPCVKNSGWFLEGDFARMLQSRHPGEARVYARVTSTGSVETGDEVRLLA